METTYEKAGCKQFFKKHKGTEQNVRQLVDQALEAQAATGMAKCKRAASSRVNGHIVYECRVNLRLDGSVRLAFTMDGKKADVLFITSTLQKDEFTHELERALKEVGK